ncbi:MAG: caspase family protein [Rectinemataceae bacterium]
MMAKRGCGTTSARLSKPGFGLLAGLAIFLLFLVSCSPSIEITTDRRALIIGISDYANTIDQDLTYPENDAIDMDKLLLAQGWTTSRMTDAQATLSNIESEMSSFFADMDKNSTALVYYSGHGTLSNDGYDGDPALVPNDFDFTSWKPLITAADLSKMITDYIPTKNVIVVADSCYSGGFVSSRESSDVIPQSYIPYGTNSSVSALAALGQFGDLLAANAAEKGSLAPIVISAAGNSELSYETSALGNGVFTYYLLEAATGGDANHDGFVTCTEAYTYAAKAIDANWNRISSSSDAFYPHISGGLRDLVLFTK